jgi:calcineurin-like phosphoesterase family protein
LSFRKQLNGQIHLIRGNHDKMIRGALAIMFVTVSDYKRIKVAFIDGPKSRQAIVLCHYAYRTWHGSGRGTWNLHGHSHGNLESIDTMLQLDVGVDCHNYAPVSLDEVKAFMTKRIFEPVDHHGRQ